MYEELIKNLRVCSQCDFGQDCNGCTQKSDDAFCCDKLLHQAADAIEELEKQLREEKVDNVNLTGWLAEEHAKAEDFENRLNLWRQDKIRRWIPVTERLPEKGIEVLVFAEGKIEGFFGDTVIAISKRYDFKIFTDFEAVEVWQSPWQYFLTDYEITHWMPLPQPPEAEEGD